MKLSEQGASFPDETPQGAVTGFVGDVSAELAAFFDKLPGVTLEEAERRVEERVGKAAR